MGTVSENAAEQTSKTRCTPSFLVACPAGWALTLGLLSLQARPQGPPWKLRPGASCFLGEVGEAGSPSFPRTWDTSSGAEPGAGRSLTLARGEDRGRCGGQGEEGRQCALWPEPWVSNLSMRDLGYVLQPLQASVSPLVKCRGLDLGEI